MSHYDPVARSKSRASQLSDATYHSFADPDVYDLSASPTKLSFDAPRPSTDLPPPSSARMDRQDSGYGSVCSRPSISSSRHRTSTMSTTTSSSRPRTSTRPSIHRASRSGPVAPVPNFSNLNSRRDSLVQTPATYDSAQTSYFYFPSPDPLPSEDYPLAPRPVTSHHHSYQDPMPRSETPSYPLPPQTTHYWTSDQTRRLEYAAIDAASRGVKGWVLRNMVPDCFVPKGKKRVGFEDDGGSVRRFRLELEEGEEEKAVVKGRRRGTWL